MRGGRRAHDGQVTGNTLKSPEGPANLRQLRQAPRPFNAICLPVLNHGSSIRFDGHQETSRPLSGPQQALVTISSPLANITVMSLTDDVKVAKVS
jgi:hypothetical protein